MNTDSFWEPPSHSYPKWGIEEFDADMSKTSWSSLPEVIHFREATLSQINNALRDELAHGTNPTIDLAKQGLYNQLDTHTLFHPNNVRWIADSVSVFAEPNILKHFQNGIDGVTPMPYEVKWINIKSSQNGAYSMQRSFFDKVVWIMENDPKLLYI